MQISKAFLVLGAAGLCMSPLLVSAADTEAQIKAREALRERMNEAQPAAPAAEKPAAPAPVKREPRKAVKPAPAPKPAKPAPAPKPSPVVEPAPIAQPAPEAPVLVLPPSADPEALAKAQEAMRAKMAEVEQQQPQAIQPAPSAVIETRRVKPAPPVVVEQPVPVQPTPAPVEPTPQPQQPAQPPVVSAPPAQPEQPSASFAPPPEVVDDQAAAKAREAMRNRMDEVIATQPAQTPTARPQGPTAKSQEAPVAKAQEPKAPKVQPAFPPIQGPALPISAEKQQKLSELLTRYKADQVTPEQYHAERARILAAP